MFSPYSSTFPCDQVTEGPVKDLKWNQQDCGKPCGACHAGRGGIGTQPELPCDPAPTGFNEGVGSDAGRVAHGAGILGSELDSAIEVLTVKLFIVFAGFVLPVEDSFAGPRREIQILPRLGPGESLHCLVFKATVPPVPPTCLSATCLRAKNAQGLVFYLTNL